MITSLSCPGDTIREHLEHIQMSPDELAEKLGLSQDQVQDLLNGEAVLTKLIAYTLEAILGPPAIFWLRLEENYRRQCRELYIMPEIDLHKFINNVCFSYRHDYGLLPLEVQKEVRLELGEWLRAMYNNLPTGHLLRDIFQQWIEAI